MKLANAVRMIALSLLVAAGAAACADDPVGPQQSDNATQCIWIKGILHCAD